MTALDLTPEEYAKEPGARLTAERAAKALREAVAYRVYADLSRGWRITMPNLEETGLLHVTYAFIRELAADTKRWGTDTWSQMPDALRRSPADSANDSSSPCSMRCAATCASAPPSSPRKAANASRASPRPTSSHRGHSPTNTHTAGVAYPRSRKKGDRSITDMFVSGLSAYGRWLRNRSGLKAVDGSELSVQDAEDTIRALLEVMKVEGIVERSTRRTARSPASKSTKPPCSGGPATAHAAPSTPSTRHHRRRRRTGQPLLPRLLPDPRHQPRWPERRRAHRAGSSQRP